MWWGVVLCRNLVSHAIPPASENGDSGGGLDDPRVDDLGGGEPCGVPPRSGLRATSAGIMSRPPVARTAMRRLVDRARPAVCVATQKGILRVVRPGGLHLASRSGCSTDSLYRVPYGTSRGLGSHYRRDQDESPWRSGVSRDGRRLLHRLPCVRHTGRDEGDAERRVHCTAVV